MAVSTQAFKCVPVLLLAAGAYAAGCAVPAEKNLCSTRSEPVALGSVQWNGWGRELDNTRYQPVPAIRATDVPKLALKWAYGYQGGTEFGQPTLVDGRLFVTSSSGRIYALDAKTGCTYWTYDAPDGSRTAITIGELGQAKRAAIPKKLKRTLAHLDVIKAPSAAVFGDDTGAVYALDAQKGTLLWKTQVDAHPSARIVGAPALYNDRLYVAVASTEETAAANPTTAAGPFPATWLPATSPAGESSGEATPCSRPRSPRSGTAPGFRNSARRAPPSHRLPPLTPSAVCSTWAPAVQRQGSSSRSPMPLPHST